MEENLAKMIGKKRSEETRAKIFSSLSGETNPMFGKKGELHPKFGKSISQETKSKISAGKGTAIKVTDIKKKYFRNFFFNQKSSKNVKYRSFRFI